MFPVFDLDSAEFVLSLRRRHFGRNPPGRVVGIARIENRRFHERASAVNRPREFLIAKSHNASCRAPSKPRHLESTRPNFRLVSSDWIGKTGIRFGVTSIAPSGTELETDVQSCEDRDPAHMIGT
jgi:hypothetical protein